MDREYLLRQRADAFRHALEDLQAADADARRLLSWLTPLFDDVEAGRIVPPYPYKFAVALGPDHAFYRPGNPILVVESAFVEALEDWNAQPWYRELVRTRGI
jgi:hypothetical protein